MENIWGWQKAKAPPGVACTLLPRDKIRLGQIATHNPFAAGPFMKCSTPSCFNPT